MSRANWVAGMAALLSAVACSEGDGGSGNQAGAGGTPASGGAAPNGGTASGGAASAVTATCEPEQAKLTYEDGGESVYELNGWPALFGADMGQARRISGRLGAGQYEVVFEPQTDDANPAWPGVILDTQPWPVRRAIVAHATADALGPVRCVTEGSGSTVARRGDDLLFDFKNMDVMAACADRPVSGEIHLCFESGGCDAFEGGSVNGTPWVLQPDTWAGALGNWSVEFADGSYMRARTSGLTNGPALWALIVTSPSGPYGGAVYCASGGTVEETEGSFGYTIMHWTGLGELNCGAGTGTAKGCLQGE
jgi:hypothetical protein